jgi:monoamine oxidase
MARAGTGPNRRDFLVGAAGVAIGGAVGAGVVAMTSDDATGAPASSASTTGSSPQRRADVVVVGAGFAGLAAGRALARAGVDVMVVEARDRVGGRVVNREIPGGEVVEAGGTYIGPTQTRMADLAAEYGIDTYPTHAVGNVVSDLAGERSEVGPSSEVLADYARLIGQIDAMAATVPVDEPWAAPSAAAWDATTFQGWLDENASTVGAVAMITTAGHTLWAAEPRELSLLFVLFYVAAAGNEDEAGSLARLFDVVDGAQELRFVGGSHRLAEAMADELGDRVRLSTPVRAIGQGDGVVVHADGVSVEADHVIVAVPPPLVAQLTFDPPLPALTAQMLLHRPMGSAIKCQAVYETPFWREAGFSGESLSDSGPADLTFDNTPQGSTQGVLVGFIGGTAAREWSGRPADERRAAVLANFAAMFGDRALEPVHYFDQDWSSEVWSRGGPVAAAPTGVLSDFGSAIRQPVGAIHWAGTETATYWNGYMEGAVRSGERAAQEVLDARR